MFRTTRRIVLFSVITGVSLTSIIAWITGALHFVAGQAVRLWNQAVAWVTSSDGGGALLAGVLGIGLPLIGIFALLLVITDS